MTHAPGHIRDAFCEALQWGDPTNPDEATSAGLTRRELCAELAGCTDQLPAEAQDLIDGTGFTYGEAAELMKLDFTSEQT